MHPHLPGLENIMRPKGYTNEMIYTHRTNIYKIPDYSKHLKNLTVEDKVSRFGYLITDYMIDKLMLNMCYHPEEHELWYARTDDTRVGWGHLARNPDDVAGASLERGGDEPSRGDPSSGSEHDVAGGDGPSDRRGHAQRPDGGPLRDLSAEAPS